MIPSMDSILLDLVALQARKNQHSLLQSMQAKPLEEAYLEEAYLVLLVKLGLITGKISLL